MDVLNTFMHAAYMKRTDGLDLNLLKLLDVLLDEGSVTEAARRLGRTQPAVSQALGRLREAVGDPLFVRQGRRLVPTARAEQLGHAARIALRTLDQALLSAPAFDPASSRRAFRVSAPDALGPLVPSLLAALSDAPGVSLELLPRSGVAGVDEADLVLDVLPDEASGVVARRLGKLHAVVACRRGHPSLDEPWDAAAWCRWPHVLVRTDTVTRSTVELALDREGLTRTVGLAVPSLLLVPHVVAATDMLFTGQREILALLADTLGLVLRDTPLPQPVVPVAAMWHARHQHEPGHRWFRERVANVIESAFSA